MNLDLKNFYNPPNSARPSPFWAVNDKLDPEEIARQMKDMARVGLGGGFFHSRHGLITQYMSDEWFAAIDAAVEAARSVGTHVWLYDEDLWPSGNCGGLVAGTNDDYRSATLEAEFVPVSHKPLDDGEDVPVVAYKLLNRCGTAIASAEQIDIAAARKDLNCERVIFRRQYGQKTSWWSGESYVNLLNPDAVAEFIRRTHKVYEKRLSSEFGKTIPGIFTDEPQITQSYSGIPWWNQMPEDYGEVFGRDFWADLPYMYFDGSEALKIRLFVHRIVLRQFSQVYTKSIFEWCEANCMKFTGHFNAEDTFQDQIRCQSGGIMAHYRYMHIPGIDHLCRQINGTNGNLMSGTLTLKQVSSAARQLGRKQVLTEIFGVTRHTNTFEDFKWIGDYDLVMGANLFCPHLTLYSARGRRKRDYPPNWNYQQTYWNDLNLLNDYFARIAATLSEGKAKVDVLILHPIESATSAHRQGFRPCPGISAHQFSSRGREQILPPDVPGEDFGEANYYDSMFRKTIKAAMHAGFDCDLGDEGFIQDMGSVRDTKFRIGEMEYSVVIVPPSRTWRPSTYALLREFAENGGKVIILGALPFQIDCENSIEQWRNLAENENVMVIPSSTIQFQNALYKVIDTGYSLRGADGCPVADSYVQRRIVDDDEVFFITNSSRTGSRDYVMSFLAAQPVRMIHLDPMKGMQVQLPMEIIGEEARIKFSLPPAGSILLLKQLGESANPRADTHRDTFARTVALPSVWNYERSEPNVLVVDRACASIDGGKTWSAVDLECRIRRQLAEHFGTTAALYWQPWFAERKGVFNGKGGPVTVRYSFSCAVNEFNGAALVVENVNGGNVLVNGRKVDLTNAGWHWDRSFTKVDITNLLRQGDNIVDLRFEYNYLSDVEPIYIVGDFGVRMADAYRGEIVEDMQVISNGSWIEQGMPFYSGSLKYRTAFDLQNGVDTVKLQLRQPSAILCKVSVNGKSAGPIPWRPFEIDITDFVKTGRNELEIEVVSSRQNTFGPLHEKEGDDYQWVSSDAFEHDWIIREEFSLYDYGLIGGAELVVTEPKAGSR